MYSAEVFFMLDPRRVSLSINYTIIHSNKLRQYKQSGMSNRPKPTK